MASEQLDKIVAGLVIGVPSALLAMLGAFAHYMSKDDPSIKTKQLVGAVLLSGFTGLLACALLLQLGLNPMLCACVASVIGSTGSKGYDWMVQKAQDSSK